MLFFQELPNHLFIKAIIAVIVFFIAQCIYDLYLHPLRKFPGPRLAAIGSYYEFYYDVVKDGLYLWEIEKMHQKYGPIVRINSRSLHIHDPEYFSTIYAGSGRRINKDQRAVAGYTFPHSSIATIDHDLHRKRRGVVNPYFSKRAVAELESFINERLAALCSRLEEMMKRGASVDLTSAFSAFTADVVTYHFYGTHSDHISSEAFKYDLKDALGALLDFYHLTRFLPVPPATLKNLPTPILRLLNPNFPLVVSARKTNEKMIEKFLYDDGAVKIKSSSQFKSVIASALTCPDIPEQEKSLDRLLDEGETIIFAGIDTTARTLAVAIFHLLNNKEILRKLRAVLESASKLRSQRSWTTVELEALPYMRGVIQESLRLSYGLVVRIPRISMEETLQYHGYAIPAGTPVSQSTYLLNNDPSVFPNPSVFDPDRWARAGDAGINLDKYMVSFSKGSRGCLGINLAYAMLYMGIAKIVMSFDMELFETRKEDIEVYHTRGFAFPKEGRGAVKATITSAHS